MSDFLEIAGEGKVKAKLHHKQCLSSTLSNAVKAVKAKNALIV